MQPPSRHIKSGMTAPFWTGLNGGSLALATGVVVATGTRSSRKTCNIHAGDEAVLHMPFGCSENLECWDKVCCDTDL